MDCEGISVFMPCRSDRKESLPVLVVVAHFFPRRTSCLLCRPIQFLIFSAPPADSKVEWQFLSIDVAPESATICFRVYFFERQQVILLAADRSLICNIFPQRREALPRAI